MNSNYKIVEDIETGDVFLALPYWLDPSDKMTIMCNYREGETPKIGEYGMFNSYFDELKVIGSYESPFFYHIKCQNFKK